MSWQLLIGLNIVFTSIATLLQKTLLKDDKSDPAAFAIFFQILMVVLVGGMLTFTQGWNFAGATDVFPNIVITTILIGIFYIAIFTSLKLIDASKFIVILATRPLFTIAASTFFLQEGLTGTQLVGVGIILFSVILVTMNKFELSFGKGEWYALIAAAAVGLVATNDRYVLARMDFMPYLFLSALLPGLLIASTHLKSLPKLTYFLKPTIARNTIIMSLFQFAAIVTLLGSLKFGENSSQISSLSELNVILTVFLGIAILKERSHMGRKIVAGLLSFAGVLLLG